MTAINFLGSVVWQPGLSLAVPFQPVIVDEPENVLVGDGVDIADDKEALIMGHVLAKKREWQVGNHEVCFIEWRYALVATKITCSVVCQ